MTDVDKAREKAKATGKYVLVKVGAEWCSPCKMMQNTTWPDPSVIKKLAGYVPVALDESAHATQVDKLKISAFPTVVVLTPDGKEVTRSEGYLTAAAMERFLTAMDKIQAREHASATAEKKITKASSEHVSAEKSNGKGAESRPKAVSSDGRYCEVKPAAKPKTISTQDGRYCEVKPPVTSSSDGRYCEVTPVKEPKKPGFFKRTGKKLVGLFRSENGGADAPPRDIKSADPVKSPDRKAADPVKPADRKPADPVKPVGKPQPAFLKRVGGVLGDSFNGLLQRRQTPGGGADADPMAVCDMIDMAGVEATPKATPTAKQASQGKASTASKTSSAAKQPAEVKPSPTPVMPAAVKTPVAKASPTPVTVMVDGDLPQPEKVEDDNGANDLAEIQPLTERPVTPEPTPASRVDVAKIRARYDEAQKMLKEQYKPTARAIYAAIVRDDPENKSGVADMAYLRCISLMVTRNDEVLRRQAYARVCEFDQRYPQSNNRDYYTMMRAVLASDLGNKDEAMRLLSDFPSRFPNSSRLPQARAEWGKLTKQPMATPAPGSSTAAAAEATPEKDKKTATSVSQEEKTVNTRKEKSSSVKESASSSKKTSSEGKKAPKSAYEMPRCAPTSEPAPMPQATPRQGLLRNMFNGLRRL